MQSFDFIRAADASAAVAAGAQSHTAQQGASVRFLAGGTTLVDLMKLGVEHPDRVVDINRLGLADIRAEADGGLFVGATARNSDLR
jgi:xanthine dehydrogenase YagS FAD-binding subunit